MAKKLVMLVTADSEVQRLIGLVLRRLDVAVVSDHDPQLVLKWMDCMRADLLLIDLASEDSVDIIRQLEANVATRDIPLVAMATADTFAGNKEARTALTAGAVDVLLKPFAVADLYQRVSKYLYWQPKERCNAR